MKTTSDLLWQLVHSMNNAEKLFFKRNFAGSQGPGQRLYLALFDALVTQKIYNEELLLKKLGPSIHKKNISFQKHYLQRQICEALVSYESQSKSGPDIYKQVQLIRMYRKKGMMEEAHSIWKKSVIQARKTESFALLNLLKTEFEKMILFSSLHTSYDELHSVFKSNLITYTEYAEMITLRDIYTEILLLKRKTHFDMDEGLQKKVNELLLKVNSCTAHTNNRSFWYGHYYRMGKATLLYLLNEPDALELLQEVFTDWKKNQNFINTHGEYYIELLYMINYAGIRQESYDYVLAVFNDPLNAGIKEPVQRANFEAIRYLALNKIYNKTARYSEVRKLVASMKEQYTSWEPMLNADINRTAHLSLAIASFVLEQFDDAHYFAKRAITFFRDGARDEHLSVAQMLLLLITYNLNNPKLFDAQYRSTYNYFYKRKKRHPFETALVQCLHRTFYMTDEQSRREEFRKALRVFDQHKEDVVQQMTFNIFNYPGWLISRVERISYRQYVERKVKLGVEA